MARSAAVTGGANGIGKATSLRLAAQGWCVVAADRDEAALDDLVRTSDGQIVAVVGDLTDADTIERIRRAADDAGELGAWVNNAAILADGPLHEMDDAQIDEMLSVNLRATILGTRAAIRSFRSRNVPGAIVNLSSVHATHTFPGHPIYAATKGAIESLTRQVCVEYGGLGIRCNAVAPGAVWTRMTAGDAASGDVVAGRLAAAEALSPMGRVSSPEEIADAVMFLLSERATSINGHVLAVDNGMAAQGGV